MVTLKDINDAIDHVCTMQQRAFAYQRVPRYNIGYSYFAGQPFMPRSIQLVVLNKKMECQVKAGDPRLNEPDAAKQQTWNFDHLPTKDEMLEVLIGYFQKLNQDTREKLCRKELDLLEFHLRHGSSTYRSTPVPAVPVLIEELCEV